MGLIGLGPGVWEFGFKDLGLGGLKGFRNWGLGIWGLKLKVYGFRVQGIGLGLRD